MATKNKYVFPTGQDHHWRAQSGRALNLMLNNTDKWAAYPVSARVVSAYRSGTGET